MPKSFDVTLRNDHRPRFPERCISCLEQPDSTVRVWHQTQSWLLLVFLPFLLVAGWISVSVPICRGCKPRFLKQRWGRNLVGWTIAVLTIVFVFPLVRTWSGVIRHLAVLGMVMVVVSPWILVEVSWPRAIDTTASKDSVVYAFASREYAAAFHACNRAAVLESEVAVAEFAVPRAVPEAVGTDAFAERAIAALRADGEVRSIRYDAAAFRLEVGTGDDLLVVSLDNGYREFKVAASAERDQAVREFVRGASLLGTGVVPEDWGPAQSKVFPIVKPPWFFECERLRASNAGLPDLGFRYTRIADHLGACVGYDHDRGMAYLGKQTLEQWGVSFDEVFKQAIVNLSKRESGGFACVSPGLFRSTWCDGYDAGRILLPALWRGLVEAGNPVLMIPHRGALLVAGSRDADALSAMLRIVEEEAERPWPITQMAFELADGRLRPFVPESGHPRRVDFARLFHTTLGSAYQAQKPLLEAHLNGQGEAVYVPNYLAALDERTGSVTSYAVCVPTGPNLIPQVQRVGVASMDGVSLPHVIGFDRLESLPGVNLRATDDCPVRYRVDRFPPLEELRRLAPDEGFRE